MRYVWELNDLQGPTAFAIGTVLEQDRGPSHLIGFTCGTTDKDEAQFHLVDLKNGHVGPGMIAEEMVKHLNEKGMRPVHRRLTLVECVRDALLDAIDERVHGMRD